jgi:hypothetical protein
MNQNEAAVAAAAAPEINLDDAFISYEEFAKTIRRKSVYDEHLAIRVSDFDELIKPKLQLARRYFHNKNYNHVYDASKYKKVYITSDIHSDCRKFMELLYTNDIIDLPTYVDDEGDEYEVTEALYSNVIYSSYGFEDFTWKQENIALVILGDLVDGKRSESGQVDDHTGMFEYLLHCFIHNMRVKAHKMNSDVLFTMGNHDYHAIIDIDNTTIPERYVHDHAKLFYDHSDGTKWKKRRRKVLLPFYEVIPLFCVAFIANNAYEFVGIHAGFHKNNGSSNFDSIIKAQNIVNSITIQDSLRSLHKTVKALLYVPFVELIENKEEDGGLWSRYYENYDACEKIQKDLENVKLVIVGHCPTIRREKPAALRLQQKTMREHPALYVGCNQGAGGRGCVTLSCNNKLAHVDVSMSTSFYDYEDKSDHINRDFEMLLLEHDEALPSDEKYYNIISRVSKSGGKINAIMPVAEAPAAIEPPKIIGGRYHINRKLTKRKSSKRRQTRRRR